MNRTKSCIKCLKELPLNKFHNDENRKGGKYHSCKECVKHRNEIYRENNKEKIKKQKEAYKSDPYNQKKIKIGKRKYVKNNPDIENARSARRRASKRNATPKWSELDKIRILYKKAKWLEELTGFKYDVDHVIPLSCDDVCGLHVWANLQILERSLNRSKNNKYDKRRG